MNAENSADADLMAYRELVEDLSFASMSEFNIAPTAALKMEPLTIATTAKTRSRSVTIDTLP
jgi:hypothetical protein